MSVAEKLGALRLILGHKQGLSEKEYLFAPSLEDQVIPRGAVVELIGSYKFEWIAHFLAQHPDFHIFWAERDPSILPTALHQRGVNLSHITFALLGDNFVTSLRRAIQSQAFQIVLAPNLFDEIKVLQAFQLFTEKSNSTLFLFGKNKASTAWPISVQLQIEKGENGKFEIEILKQRHGKFS